MTSGNPILDKNLQCIEKYNPQLKEKLLNLPCLTNDIQLTETQLQEPNLTYNGFPLHSEIGAELEAKKLFTESKTDSLSIHIIFGMGLGYLFKEFATNTKGSVILYEPNLEILRVTLELVDFSEELSKGNVKLASDFQELDQVFVQVYQYQSEVFLLFLDSYKTLFGGEIAPLLTQAELVKGMFKEDLCSMQKRGLEYLQTVIKNLSHSLEATPLKELKDIYKGKTALVVSAGPTLDVNIETIKKNRDNVVIFCVGTAFKALANNGITPDFLNIVEMIDCSSQVKGYDLTDINLIFAPSTNESTQILKAKSKFIFPAASTRAGQYWSQLTGIDTTEYVSKGTVSYEALSSAKMLGFKKIILIGQDLAFINNSCYSKDAAYSDMIFEINPETGKPEYKVKDYDSYIKSHIPIGADAEESSHKDFADMRIRVLNEKLHFVKGITGEMLPTDIGYAFFVDLFREFAFLNPDLDLINTSMLGAQIDGFKNLPLEQALENALPVEKVEISTKFEYDKKTILENLTKEKLFLENVLQNFIKTKDYFYRFEREIKRNKTLTKEANKYYKLILDAYDHATVEYFEKNLLYKITAINESLEIKHYSETSKDTGEERVKNIYNLMKNYFHNTEIKILGLHKEITKQEEIISESTNSTSQKSIC